jgi:hypothetical protein
MFKLRRASASEVLIPRQKPEAASESGSRRRSIGHSDVTVWYRRDWHATIHNEAAFEIVDHSRI